MRYAVETVETVHRLYQVEAADEDEARRRALLWFRDPDVVKDGLVGGPHGEKLQNRRVIGITQAAQAKAAADARDPSADS